MFHFSFWRRLAIVASLLLLMTMSMPLLMAPGRAHAATLLNLNPAQGPVGLTVQVTGSGYQPSTYTEIWFNSQRVQYTGTDSNGNLNTTFLVPNVATNQTYPVWATQGNIYAPANFFVTSGVAPPAAPNIIGAKPYGPFHIDVGWVDYSNNESGFQIFNGVTSNYAPASSGTGKSVWYRWSVSAPSTYMCFRVRAYNSGGYSAWVPINGWTCTSSDPGGVPKPPTNVTAKGINSSTIEITYTDQANNETAFQLWNGVVIQTWLGELPGTGSTVVWDWTGLAPHTYMCLKIRTYNEYGASAWAPANSWACSSSTG